VTHTRLADMTSR